MYDNKIVRSIALVKDDENVLIIGGSNGVSATNHILNFNVNSL